jgi:hypothetical protein
VRPQVQIAVPPFSPETIWIGPQPPSVERICARGPLLVHFVDIAHVSSVRTLPYLAAWAERYRELGLSIIGVNSPRFPFTADRDKLTAALARLEVSFPVVLDSSYEAWHDYGCEGWPSLFLWGRGGALRWFHFGEGEYQATEAAMQDELRELRGADLELPGIIAPLRPSEAPGALVVAPSDEVFPGGSASKPWQASAGDPRLQIDYSAGGAWATVDGHGWLEVSLDGAPETRLLVEAPGAYELAGDDRHRSHQLSIRAADGVSIWAVGFSAGVP